MTRWFYLMALLSACTPQFEGRYRVDAVDPDDCGIRDDALRTQLTLDLAADQYLDATVPWIDDSLTCGRDRDDPDSFSCVSALDTGIAIVGVVDVDAGRMWLAHVAPDCQSDLELTWVRGPGPDSRSGTLPTPH